MTTQPAGEHHTGTLDLTGEGNAPEPRLPNDIDPQAVEAATRAHIENAGWDWNDLGSDQLEHQAAKAVLLADMRIALRAAYPAIRHQVAEEIAVALEAEARGDYDAADDLRWAATKAREIGGHRPIGVHLTDVGVFVRCSCGKNPTPKYWIEQHWQGDRVEGERLVREMLESAREIEGEA